MNDGAGRMLVIVGIIMVVVVILGILAAIAYPSYVEYVNRGKRAEAKAAMLFGDRGAKPTHLDDLAPQCGREILARQ